MAATSELMIERRGAARSAARRRANFVIFLGPAIVLTVLFFVVPVLIDIAVSFTDLSRSLRVTQIHHGAIREGVSAAIAACRRSSA